MLLAGLSTRFNPLAALTSLIVLALKFVLVFVFQAQSVAGERNALWYAEKEAPPINTQSIVVLLKRGSTTTQCILIRSAMLLET